MEATDRYLSLALSASALSIWFTTARQQNGRQVLRVVRWRTLL